MSTKLDYRSYIKLFRGPLVGEPNRAQIVNAIDKALDIYASYQGQLTASDLSAQSMLCTVRAELVEKLGPRGMVREASDWVHPRNPLPG